MGFSRGLAHGWGGIVKRHFLHGENLHSVTFQRRSPSEVEIIVGEDKTLFSVSQNCQRINLASLDKRFRAVTARNKDMIFVWLDGRVHELVEIEETNDAASLHSNQDEIRAPMPGMIIKLNVKPGDKVEKDQIVAVLEAMKMEHNLRAPRTGLVEAVDVKLGQTVSADAQLVHLGKA